MGESAGDGLNRGFRSGLPLSGVRVLDLSRLLPGPWATMFLADYGAEVIKIEEPGRGDYSRWSYPRYKSQSVYFSSVNRNKSSVVLDLSAEMGIEAFFRMVNSVDVVVESYRPGVADRLGIGYQRVAASNARIIYCSVTGFGQSGPYRDHAGHDLNISGLSGFLNHGGDSVPEVPGLQMGDFAGATMTLTAILLALRERDITGEGQHLDVSMFDSLMSWMTILGTASFAKMAGYSASPALEAFGGNPRYCIYQTSDGGYVSVSLLERSFWERFCRIVGRPDLVNPDESEADRLSDHGVLGIKYRSALSELFLTRSRDEWSSFLLEKGIPCFPVNSPEEAFSDRHVMEREMVNWIDHPEDGPIPQLGFPVKGSKMAPRITRPAPSLGEDSAEILAALGYQEHEIERISGGFDG